MAEPPVGVVYGVVLHQLDGAVVACDGIVPLLLLHKSVALNNVIGILSIMLEVIRNWQFSVVSTIL